MLSKKFYLPIGILIVVTCAVVLVSLRSDVPTEPIKVYKATTPIKRSVTPSEPMTVSASKTVESMPTEAIEDAPVSTSEFTRSELLERFPQYDFHSPESKENLHSILRKEKILAELRAGNAELERKIAKQEAAKELLSYLESAGDHLKMEYPDVTAFRKKYSDPQIEDFIREYPDENERYAFFERTLEASKIYREMADRILATPGVPENLSSRHLETVYGIPSKDEISEGLELLRSKGVFNE